MGVKATSDSAIQIGVMGSAFDVKDEAEGRKLREQARILGEAIAAQARVLITGATTGLPRLVSLAARNSGGLTVGVSPAISRDEHENVYRYPTDAYEVLIFTGFGLKGRNVVNVRACDIIIIFSGSMGTLNEFTTAYDEGKVIGVIEGSGGVSDKIRDIVEACAKPSRCRILFDADPRRLITRCISCYGELASRGELFPPFADSSVDSSEAEPRN